MNPKYYKKVLLPIIVSANDFCWGKGDGEIRCCCEHFDNEFEPKCNLNISNLKYNENDEVEKPKECLELKNK